MRFPILSLVIAAAAVVSVPTLRAAQVILIDFGGTNITTTGAAPNDPVNAWNSIPTGVSLTDTGLQAGLVAVDNSPTSLGLQMVRRFNGVNENGTQVSTQFPVNATRDSLFGNTAVFNSLSNVFPQFKLTNLDASSTYSLTFYASRAGVGDNRETQYQIDGAAMNLAFLNAANNVDGFTTVTGIQPDGSNEITISLSPGPNNTNAGTLFTYLGVLKVESQPVPEPGSAVLVLAGLLVCARRRRA